jgi:hypothetical protein
MSTWLDSLINQGPISRIRRNHGLEHATLHILAKRLSRRALAGHSDAGGFWIVGDVETDVLRSAVEDALFRMQHGEHSLAVHPNCGTNYVTSGTLAGLAGAATMMGAGPRLRDKAERFSLAALLATMTLILSQPLGLFLQARITTSGIPGSLRIVEIKPAQASGYFGPTRFGALPVHRVTTAD